MKEPKLPSWMNYSDYEDDYKEETCDINEIIEYLKAGKWNQFVKEELLSW